MANFTHATNDNSVASLIAGSTTQTLQYPNNVTAGSLLVAVTHNWDTSTCSLADDVNGAWAQGVLDQGRENTGIYYKIGSVGGSRPTITATFGVSTSWRVLIIAEFIPVGTVTADGSGVGQYVVTGSATTDADTSTALATSGANDLIIGGITYYSVASVTEGTGFTSVANLIDGDAHARYAMEYKLDAGAAGSPAATWTGSDTTSYTAVAMAFNSTTGGASPITWLPTLKTVQGKKWVAIPSGSKVTIS